MPSQHIRLLDKDAILREKAREAPKGADLTDLIDAMRTAMVTHDGIGIAAPQIGEAVRVFVVAKSLFPPEIRAKLPSDVFINPRVLKKSFKRERNEEGCLSVPGVFGEVNRSVRITVEAYDVRGGKFRVAAEGLLARVLQHELDHLDGTLFVDRARRQTFHEVLTDGTSRPWTPPER